MYLRSNLRKALINGIKDVFENKFRENVAHARARYMYVLRRRNRARRRDPREFVDAK